MTFISPDTIRSEFSRAMSDMFRAEVPAYGTLIELVEEINSQVLERDEALRSELAETDGVNRITKERHGAIRLGTEVELNTIRRLFAVMGMSPVGYYDLSVANIPVHATAFRPIGNEALSINPFRVFTSLLRLDMITDEDLRQEIAAIIAGRKIFTARALELITQAEQDGGLSQSDATEFVWEALETFRWHSKARVDKAMFDRLLNAHRLIADAISFRGPHINHITPRTLDIDAAQEAMQKHGIDPKAVIEGPPKRNCPILLRQTSFRAVNESVEFKTVNGASEQGHHTARFGEIEQRGAALTPKGRALYDALLEEVRDNVSPQGDGSNAIEYVDVLKRVFANFPDTWSELRKQGLVYFKYYLTEAGATGTFENVKDLEEMIAYDLVGYSPIVYEDFLPVSAAGIFKSNLGEDKEIVFKKSPNQRLFEKAMGVRVLDEFALYGEIESASKDKIMANTQAAA